MFPLLFMLWPIQRRTLIRATWQLSTTLICVHQTQTGLNLITGLAQEQLKAASHLCNMLIFALLRSEIRYVSPIRPCTKATSLYSVAVVLSYCCTFYFVEQGFTYKNTGWAHKEIRHRRNNCYHLFTFTFVSLLHFSTITVITFSGQSLWH